ncbi:peptidylprolyl isomerase [Parvibaculaceae bacterium PLY_AMNH_Bact1]|nr:peptidylprolyl isomerase [Parvibaculaceae bacterium PLY_AMNH_Bact1]
MPRILRDPLFHFAIVGLALFFLFSALGQAESDADSNEIRVDRETVLTFIQYRTRSFDRNMAEQRLNALGEEELNRLVDEYLREEVLYREGLGLGLDADDYVIRRRLIQKVEFLAEGFASAAVDLTDEDLQAHFDANKQDYFVAPSITFTHVYFDKAKHGDAALTLAADALERLNGEQVPFSGAPGQGDRFPFHVNYVERTYDFVASHFGPDMTANLFALAADDGVWQGVFKSPYGAHLVMVTSVSLGKDAVFEDVKARVTEDARRVRLEADKEAAIAQIAAEYDIEIDLSAGATE